MLMHLLNSKESEEGPWVKVVEKTLADSRQVADPQKLQTFHFQHQPAKYVRVRCKTWYGNGAGLQYFRMSNKGVFWNINLLI